MNAIRASWSLALSPSCSPTLPPCTWPAPTSNLLVGGRRSMSPAASPGLVCRSIYAALMVSAELSRRVGKVLGYPPLCETSGLQRRKFLEALVNADAFGICPAGGDPEGQENRPNLRIVGSDQFEEVRPGAVPPSRGIPRSPHGRRPSLRRLAGGAASCPQIGSDSGADRAARRRPGPRRSYYESVQVPRYG